MNNGAESPRPSRKRFGSASEETILKQVNGDGLSIANVHELDTLKAELMREIRLEINKAKQEIIDGEWIGENIPIILHGKFNDEFHINFMLRQIQLLKQNSTEGKAEEITHSNSLDEMNHGI